MRYSVKDESILVNILLLPARFFTLPVKISWLYITFVNHIHTVFKETMVEPGIDCTHGKLNPGTFGTLNKFR
ncbi:MAG: hypothetical protein ACOCZL_04485 [Bacteroidota bacterium]